MYICHISDCHGNLPTLPDGAEKAEIVVSSGDFFPNKTIGNRHIEPEYQSRWLEENLPVFKEWLGDRPFLFCSGNHDFIDPSTQFKDFGIKAFNLDDRVFRYKDWVFYGFPYIPYMDGDWNFEKTRKEMNDEINLMKERIIKSGNILDILVCHCPPYGILDLSYDYHYGNSLLTNWLDYEVDLKLPSYILTGHIHEDHAIEQYPNESLEDTILISNAATTVHLIELNKKVKI